MELTFAWVVNVEQPVERELVLARRIDHPAHAVAFHEHVRGPGETHSARVVAAVRGGERLVTILLTRLLHGHWATNAAVDGRNLKYSMAISGGVVWKDRHVSNVGEATLAVTRQTTANPGIADALLFLCTNIGA